MNSSIDVFQKSKMFSVLEYLITFQRFPFYFLASFFYKFSWASEIRDGWCKPVVLFSLLNCRLHHKKDGLYFMFVALAITPSGTNEHVFDRSCLDAAWKQPVWHATCLMTPAEPATFAEWPFVWRMRIMSLLRHLETRCTIQPNVVGQTWRSKRRERGLLYFQRSCRVR